MIQTVKNCSVCRYIKQDPSLIKRLYKSRAYVRLGEPISDIAEDTGLGYRSLLMHCKKHQALSEDDLQKSRIREAEKIAKNERIRQLVKHSDVRQLVMDKGYEGIETGEIKLNASSVINAANKEADIELKVKDQNIALMGMIAKFASGELQGPASGDTTSSTDLLN